MSEQSPTPALSYGAKSYKGQPPLRKGYIPLEELERVKPPKALHQYANPQGLVMYALAHEYGLQNGRQSAWNGQIGLYNVNTGERDIYQAGGGGLAKAADALDESKKNGATPGIASHIGFGRSPGDSKEINAVFPIMDVTRWENHEKPDPRNPGQNVWESHKYGNFFWLNAPASEIGGRTDIGIHSSKPGEKLQRGSAKDLGRESLGCLSVPYKQMPHLAARIRETGVDRIIMLNPDVAREPRLKEKELPPPMKPPEAKWYKPPGPAEDGSAVNGAARRKKADHPTSFYALLDGQHLPQRYASSEAHSGERLLSQALPNAKHAITQRA